MKKITILVLILIFILSLVGCQKEQDKPCTPAELKVDRIVMAYSDNENNSSKETVITDQETISELLDLHKSIKKEKTGQPLTDEQIKIVFYMGEMPEIEWYLSVNKKNDNTEFITCSNVWAQGNYVIKSDFNYDRLIEILNTTN